MIFHLETGFVGDLPLALFDQLVMELFDSSAAYADNVVMMILDGDFEYRATALELESADQAGLLALGQNPVDGCDADLFTLLDQHLIEVFCADVTAAIVLQHLQNLDAGKRNLKTGFLEFG